MSFPLPSTSTSPIQQELNNIYNGISFEFARVQNLFNQISTTIYANDLGFTPAQIFSTLGDNGYGVVLWMSTLANLIGSVTGTTPPAIPNTINLNYSSTGLITVPPGLVIPGGGGGFTPG